ncbi:pirin family protein [uncultured Algibacter sp.]|uniref:pirin family protein n=1 Tax=uncultured Algibacter sp. TaxID=298659 RepID=UPI003217BDBB
MPLHKLDRNTIETGGFHGIIQKRLIVNSNYGPRSGVTHGTWEGIGNLVYLADSWFETGVATGLHPHQYIDVLTFVVDGRLDHEGSLEHGVGLNALDFQVQKSGKQGFKHNEINNGTETTRMLQLWLLPEKQEPEASFRVHQATKGKITKVYGSQDGNSTQIGVGHLLKGDTYKTQENSLIYIVKGKASIKDEILSEGVLIASNSDILKSTEDSLFIIVYIQN